MAFTDLEEHLQEVFGEASQVLGYDASISWRTTRKVLTPAEKRAKWRARVRQISAKRLAAQVAAVLSGLVPTRCQHEGCCNLLLPIRFNGGHPRYYCKRTHARAHRLDQKRRCAKWLREKRGRRRARRYASGELPTRCQWEGCCNLLRFRGGGRPPRYCSKAFHPGYWRKVQPMERQCEAPGCTAKFTTKGRRRTCSSACRQRLWYHSVP